MSGLNSNYLARLAGSGNDFRSEKAWTAFRIGAYVGLSYAAAKFLHNRAAKIILGTAGVIAVVSFETEVQRTARRAALEKSWKPLLESGDFSAIFGWKRPSTPEEALEMIKVARKDWGETVARLHLAKVYLNLFGEQPAQEATFDDLVDSIEGGHNDLRAEVQKAWSTKDITITFKKSDKDGVNSDLVGD